MAPHDEPITSWPVPEDMELVEVLTGGEVFFEVDGVDKVFTNGAIFWHQTGESTICRTPSDNPYRCAVFLFSVSELRRPVDRVGFWDLDIDLDKFVADCFELFHSNKISKDILCLYIYSNLLRHTTVSNDLSKYHDYPLVLEKMIHFIQNNYGHKISVPDIANAGGISEPHVFKVFQKHLAITPYQYILSLQLSRARTMLAGSSLPIKAIAVECGFDNIEVFYRRFKENTGMPPGKYREKYLPYEFSEDNAAG